MARKGTAKPVPKQAGINQLLLNRKLSVAFTTPTFARLYTAAQENGGKIECTEQEAVAARSELRRIRRYAERPGVEAGDELMSWVNGNIDRLTRALESGTPEVETVPCSRCGKRERWFGDLCKRCADEVGDRPVGKVE